MRGFWKRASDVKELETALRRDRPAPRKELVDRMVGLLDEPRAPMPQPLRRSRPAIAALVSVVALLAFAVFGGLGYAKSSGSGAFHRAAHSVGKIIKSNPSTSTKPGEGKKGEKGNANLIVLYDDGPGDDQYREKVLICHAAFPIKPGQPVQYITLRLPPSGAAAHLANHPHDYDGPCETDRPSKDD
jgi:hypothetical protein